MKPGIDFLFRPGFDAGRRLAAAGSLACTRAWPFRERGWTALLTAGDRASERLWALLKPSDSWPAAIQRSFADGRARWLLDQGVAAWPLHADPLLSRQRDWLDPAAYDLPAGGPRGRVVGYKPLRRVVTSFADADGHPRYFVKHLRRHQVRRLTAARRLLAEWWRRDPDFSIPTPGPSTGGAGHWVMRAAPGVSPRSATNSGDFAAAVAAAARCLGSLHSCPARVDTRRTRESELHDIGAWLAVMRPILDLPGVLDSALSTLAASAPLLPGSRPVLSHGDFHDGQLLIDGAAVTLLDIDTLAMAEPELDVGNFLAHLDLLEIEGVPRPSDLEELVLAAYARRGADLTSAARITWYRAATTLRLACVHAPRPRTRVTVQRLSQRAARLADCLWQAEEEGVS